MGWLTIYLVGTDELALNNENTTTFVIHNDGGHLLVILTIGDVVPRGDRIAQEHSPEIPSNKSLTVICEVLLIVRVVRNFLSNLHRPVRHYMRHFARFKRWP